MGIRQTATALVVLGISCALAAACGDPQDPVKPPPPTDDGGADAPPSVDDCSGQPDGTLCQDTKICIAGVCEGPACGDGYVSPSEECDNGPANAPGAGCEENCTWSCAPDDAARDCSSSNPCVGAGTCDPQKHTCSPGAPLAAGAPCGAGNLCVDNQCVAATCGDATVTPPEPCDNGDANGPGKGCESDCTFTCSNPATDCAPVACNTATCSAQHRCQATPDPSKDGTTCDQANGYVCKAGACIAPNAVCGNGIEEGGEDCDFGSNNGPNTGCEAGTCKFSCTGDTPGTCVDNNACHDAPTCTQVTSGGGTGYRCVTGSTKSDGATCGVGAICRAGTCALSVCGDGVRDLAKNEQCDDGNSRNLDACDASCQFEQEQRAIALKLLFDTDKTCADNAIGASIGLAARGIFQKSIDDSIKDGSCSVLFKFVSSDLSGQNGAVTVGSLSGTPYSGAGYNGTSDLDWWYSADPLTYDGSYNATATLAGAYTGGTLDATGNANLTLNVGGSIALLRLSSAHMKGTVGAPTTTPTAAATNAPPGHVAEEHLDPALKSFPRFGGTSSAPSAVLCSNINAASLANMSVAASLAQGGENACTEGYTAANKMLDVFVNGCTIKIGFAIKAIKATQPDFPRNGNARRYTLAADPITKRVSSCTDESTKQPVNLTTCLSATSYSSYFKFATDRVMIKQ